MNQLLILLSGEIGCYYYISMRADSSSSEDVRARKNKYEFNLDHGRKICIDSDFDNGNIGLLKQVTELNYRLEAIYDHKSTTPRKTWFHFRVVAPKNFRIRFSIENVSIYESMYEDLNWAKPVFKDERNQWLELKDAFLTYRGEVGLVIDYTFISNYPVYFAMAVPFTYEENQQYLRDFAYKIPQHISFKDEVIAKSCSGLNVHLLRLTEKNNSEEADNEIKRPIIFITCRVHPGEVGSSFCLLGILEFLIRPFNLQAKILLKMFEIICIPMINPDGVFEGNYRMDLNNTNLNRVYSDPSPELHPSVYSIKQVFLKLAEKRKIMFHFDLHSHSALKSAFIYGNAFEEIVTQTESELYCKLLEQNSEAFKYGLSQFTERHMKMKDKGEILTKEGCARVVISKIGNVTYSYTLQTSIFPYQNKHALMLAQNQEFQINQTFQYEQITHQSLSHRLNIKNAMVIDNMLIGCGLMVSILDILEKNPYSRLINLEESLQASRKEISQALLQSEERFKLIDIKAYQKVRLICKFSKEQFTLKYQRCWDFLANDKEFRGVKWPNNFKWFLFSEVEPKRKQKSRTKTEITESQRQLNDFINPKNSRRRYLNTEQDRKQELPVKSSLSPRRIQLEIPEPPPLSLLPDIRASLERSSMGQYTRPRNATQISRKRTNEEEISCDPCLNPFPSLQIKEMKELQQLSKKESTKNIVLSFIQEEMERMNNIRKVGLKVNSIGSRITACKGIKKASKSTKILQDANRISGDSRDKRNIVSINSLNTCEDIVNRRKLNIEDYKTGEEIEFLQNQMESVKPSPQKFINNKGPTIGANSYRQAPAAMSNKRELAKMKYSEIKKKNIIRQDINIKLPELRLYQNNKVDIFIDCRASTLPDQY